jgi:predicted ATPase/class 3 adenylate cyclase/Tfp pilus assembly protein PilF
VPSLPNGTVTFLFTDIEGSTLLLERVGDRQYADVLRDHQRLLRAAFAQGGGHEIDTQGDSFFVAFQSAWDAVATAVAAQLSVNAHAWPQGVAVRVRMGLHTGTPTIAGGHYVGLDVHRAARICASGHGGQILLSLETGHLVEDNPPPGVSLKDQGSHRLKDLQQPEKLFQVLHPELPEQFPPLKSLDAFPNNLPRQLTGFIGREREIAEVKRLLTTTCLLTLTGTGGSGKTRLALQVAADVLEGYTDGVWLAELAALSDPAPVPQTVAAALGVREVPGRPMLETLLHYLQRKKLLLVLDNCEHLVAACAQLAGELLRTCQGLRILATSREALNIQGEIAWRVPSLSLPDRRQLPSLEQLTQFEAVRLFVERAAAAKPTFALTLENAAPVAAVVQRLDGIPLAIELAAARVPALSVDQIAARLDDRFRLLTRGSRASLPRQQTLRAALDWSYQLLTEREQRLLRRFSVFAGGWTLEAAETVCGGDGIEEFEVLDLLTQLVFKSLVVTDEHNGGVRYRFLETVRQYGLEKLEEFEETEAIRKRHRDWYLGLAERAEPELRGVKQAAWFDQLETEHDNLRAALEWSHTDGEAHAGMRLTKALMRFWLVRGFVGEGRARTASILTRPEAAEPAALRGQVLWGAGVLAWRQGDYPAARAFLDESLTIRRGLGDRSGVGQVLNALGLVAREQGDLAAARALHEEYLAIGREMGDKSGISLALNNLGLVAREEGNYAAARAFHEQSLALRRELKEPFNISQSLNNLGFVVTAQKEFALARRFYEESLALSRELGDKLGIAYVLNNLGDIAYHQGDDAAARALYEESLKIKHELGDKRGIAYTLIHLGGVASRQGDVAAARTLHVESLAIRRELWDRPGIAECLEGFADLAGVQGQPRRVARLFGAAEGLREAVGAPLPPSVRADYDGKVAAVRASLGEAELARAWAEGRAMTLEQAIEYALEEEDE